MKKVKIIIIFFLLLFLGGFIYALITRQRAARLDTSSLPRPNIPKTYEGEPNLVVEIESNNFDFPKTLPVLNAIPSIISEEESIKIANNLGFNFEPVTVPDVIKGKKHRYSGSDYVLLITLESGLIDYERNLILGEVANKQLSDAQIIKTAEEFLTQNGLASSSEIKTLSVSYYEERGGQGLYQTTHESATFYQVNFTTSIADTPILTLNPQNSPFFVRVLPDGTILKAHIEKFGEIKEGEGVRKLKDYDELLTSQEEATLISLDSGNIYLPDIPKNSIKLITITEIELAYLKESSASQVLQPIFLLKGTADVSGFPDNIDAILYLPAISEKN